MPEFYDSALVLGLGGSGEAAARLLRREDAAVTVIDRKLSEGARLRAEALKAEGVRVEQAGDDLPAGDFAVCIASPGVPVDGPWIRAARARHIPVVAELELGWSRFGGRVLAITGTNGKSTVVKWAVEALQAEGLRAEPAGNYGPPACRVVAARPDLQWLVLEVSSFQLETTQHFRPHVGLLLNLVPNHLDRHGDFATYERMKARLFAQTQAGDVCVAPVAQLDRLRALSQGKGTWCSFAAEAPADYVYREGRVLHQGEPLADLRGTYFGNDVLGCNAAGLLAALHQAGRPPAHAVAAAHAFRPLPHRMELVAVKKGVRFINDSKATTLSALGAGLRMAGSRTRLIAGGLLKETDLDGVKEMLAKHGAGVYLIGRASEQMAAAWSGVVPCHPCGTLDQALVSAWRDASAGETVLLSPGCASFDQFRNYEERGERFRERVGLLPGE